MLKLSWISVLVVVLDQATKKLAVVYLAGHPAVDVTPFFDLVLVYNTGAAFGFLNDASGWQNALFILVALLVSAVILVMVRRLAAHETLAAVALLLILGAAAGNLVDRVLYGYVTDFVDLYYGSWHWPAFNIADSAISIGAVLLVLDALGLRFGRRGV